MNGSMEMVTHKRMSPFTAMILGVSALGVTGLLSLTTVVLYGMSIVDSRSWEVLNLAGEAVDGLPEFLTGMPPLVSDVFKDRRSPEYAKELSVNWDFVANGRRGGVQPAITIRNNGDEQVTLLGLRVVALDGSARPVAEWTEVVATPVTIEGEWRGPLGPNTTRRVLLSRRYGGSIGAEAIADAELEITDVRVWDPSVKGLGEDN